MNIILYGFKNSGKTTIGQYIAKRMASHFIDVDDVIEDIYFRKYNERSGVRDIYKKIGEDEFRLLEAEAILSLKKQKKSVIATGGGSVCDEDNTKFLRKIGKLIYLTYSKETIRKRMIDFGVPAFLDQQNWNQSFEKMYRDRVEKYNDIADMLIDAENKTIEEIGNEIIEVIYGK